MQLILESQVTQKLYNIEAMSPITSFSRAERLFDYAWEGRGLVIWDFSWWPGSLICMTGPRRTINVPCTLLKNMDMFGNIGKHQTQEAETAQNAATCAVIQIWPLIYSIHPNKHHATLQETDTRDLKMRTLRTCTCCPSPYHKTML